MSPQHPSIEKKQIAVLPFIEANPRQGRDAIAAGLTYELIDRLRLLDGIQCSEYKSVSQYLTAELSTAQIAYDLGVRYIINGRVTQVLAKGVEWIQVVASVEEPSTRTILWSDQLRERYDDFFKIVEKAALWIIECSNLAPRKESLKKWKGMRRRSAQAIIAFEKGISAHNKNTLEDYKRAIRLFNKAIKIDDEYSEAFISRANCRLSIYRDYDFDNTKWLIGAEKDIARAEELDADQYSQSKMLRSQILAYRGDSAGAIEAAEEAVREQPENADFHFGLAFLYDELGKHLEAAASYEAALKLQPRDLTTHFNLALQYHKIQHLARLKPAAIRALPYYKTHVAKRPTDQQKMANYAYLLYFAGKNEDAKRVIHDILRLESVDAVTYYQCGCIFALMGNTSSALEELSYAIDAGFTNKQVFENDSDLVSLHKMGEWKEMMKTLGRNKKLVAR